MRKYHLSFTLYRHLHFELSSILRELNIVFYMQMMAQVMLFHLSTVHFIIDFYRYVVSINIDTIYSSTINALTLLTWIFRYVIDIIIFNYICEGVCMKVKSKDSLEKL